jgi:hypothetical protein
MESEIPVGPKAVTALSMRLPRWIVRNSNRQLTLLIQIPGPARTLKAALPPFGQPPVGSRREEFDPWFRNTYSYFMSRKRVVPNIYLASRHVFNRDSEVWVSDSSLSKLNLSIFAAFIACQ